MKAVTICLNLLRMASHKLMTLDEVLSLIHVTGQKNLTRVWELILRQTWEGKTYTSMAEELHYQPSYLKKAAFELWNFLSELFGESITKVNCRSILEMRSLTTKQQELIEQFSRNSTLLREPNFDALEFPGDPVRLGSIFYIERPPIEELAYREISKPGSIIRIKAPRKMGKSSLLIRIMACAATQGCRTVYLDFQQLDDRNLVNLDKFLRWFCANIAQQLELKPRLDDYWDEDIGSKVSCTIYLKRYLLEQIDRPLALALNEVDRIFKYPAIAQEFLPLLRSWHEEAKQVESLKKLRLAIVHSTEVYIPLNIHQSPFNVGLPIKLPLLTLEQVQDLATRHGLDWADDSQLLRLMAMVGGHPYLVRLALYYLCQGNVTLEQLLQEAPTLAGIYKAHLQNYLAMLQAKPELAAAFKQVITVDEGVRLKPILAYELESMGLAKLDGDEVRPSCELYRLYYDSQLS